MRKYFFAILLLTSCFSLVAPGQKCPRTTRTIYVLVQNGTEAKNVRYELFQVKPKFAERDHAKYIQFIKEKLNYYELEASELINGRKARVVLTEQADALLRDYNAADYAPVEDIYGNPMKGVINNGELKFTASEANHNLLLMRLAADNFDTRYYVANFFGGCSIVDRLQLMKYRSWPEW